jgi:hypothetical protein
LSTTKLLAIQKHREYLETNKAKQPTMAPQGVAMQSPAQPPAATMKETEMKLQLEEDGLGAGWKEGFFEETVEFEEEECKDEYKKGLLESTTEDKEPTTKTTKSQKRNQRKGRSFKPRVKLESISWDYPMMLVTARWVLTDYLKKTDEEKKQMTDDEKRSLRSAWKTMRTNQDELIEIMSEPKRMEIAESKPMKKRMKKTRKKQKIIWKASMEPILEGEEEEVLEELTTRVEVMADCVNNQPETTAEESKTKMKTKSKKKRGRSKKHKGKRKYNKLKTIRAIDERTWTGETTTCSKQATKMHYWNRGRPPERTLAATETTRTKQSKSICNKGYFWNRGRPPEEDQ